MLGRRREEVRGRERERLGARPAASKNSCPGGSGMATPDPPQVILVWLSARPRVAQTPEERPE